MLAVRRAIAGLYDSLHIIRDSRNQSPQLPTEINVEYVRTDICLFSPRPCPLRPRPVMLYLHGGGGTLGNVNSCASFCAALAIKANCCVAALNYRLAPEHPYPAPLNDCRSALSFIKSHATAWGCDTSHISVGGDSAGGNLALALAMSECGIESVVSIYPVTEVYETPSTSWGKYAKGYGNDAELLLAFDEAYARDNGHVPFVSPALAPDTLLRRLPRTLLLSAGRDILLDQTTAFANLLRTTGHKQTKHVIFPNATHLFITVPGQPTAFSESVKLVADFLQ